MSISSIRSMLHRRMSAFVDWIRVDEDKVDTIREQSAEIRTRIRGQAAQDGLTVRSTPNSGSFEKKTGLRRHLQGESDVEGQDVDLPFVISPHDDEGKQIDELLNRFERYAKASYPLTQQIRTRSSIQLDFVGTKLRYDLVPMLAVAGDDEAQILLRSDGEKRHTSVQKHIEFVTKRTGTSNLLAGRVRFNECVRLVKWWREFRRAHARVIEDVPSIVLDLMCAYAYDRVQVRTTYAETLAQWFGLLAATVQKRERIAFSDFKSIPAVNRSVEWEVLDPVNGGNNIVSHWGYADVDELGEWLEESCDALNRAIAADMREDHEASLNHLVELFGNPIRHHVKVA